MGELVDTTPGLLENNINIFFIVIQFGKENIDLGTLDPLDSILELPGTGLNPMSRLHHCSDLNTQILKKIGVTIVYSGDAQGVGVNGIDFG
ncbi:MAG: hypothetical protein C5S40_00535 [ANME-2 cluster archaeon]|nr:hypothetical protein [ANME-2 cluster archaeon]